MAIHVWLFSFTAVEILGMSLTTDVQTSFDDPISKSHTAIKFPATPFLSSLPLLLLPPPFFPLSTSPPLHYPPSSPAHTHCVINSVYPVVMHIPPSFPEELIGYDMAKKAAQEALGQAGKEVCTQTYLSL